MPVLVTAADRPVAGVLVRRLLEGGGQVRATAEDGVPALRSLGVHVAVAARDDTGRIEAAATQVHTLVHLVGGLGIPDPRSELAAARAAVSAAAGAEVRRLVLVTALGAARGAKDTLLQVHGEAEALAEAVDVVSVVVRTGPVLTDALRGRLVTAGLAPDDRARAVRPVAVGDLVDLLVAVDAARSAARTGHVVVEAAGPVAVPVERLLPGGGVGRLVGRRLVDDEERTALHAAVRGPWERDPGLPDAWDLFGVAPERSRALAVAAEDPREAP